MDFIKSVKGFLGRHLITKEWLNDPELSKARIDKCKECKHYDASGGVCKICTCLMEVKVESKVNINVFHLHYEETHCPLGKWPVRNGEEIGGNDKDIANHYRQIQGKGLLK